MGSQTNVTCIETLAQLARAGRANELCEILDATHISAASVDAKGDSLLMLAAYHGHTEVVRALLERGARTDLRNARGLSPLDGAAFKGDLVMIEVLVGAGAKIDERGPDGRTPLMWAAAFARVAAVNHLLSCGADPSARDASGLTAYEHAQRMGGSALLPRLAPPIT
jgi:hypothetical protein